jgi:hypothetical protein
MLAGLDAISTTTTTMFSLVSQKVMEQPPSANKKIGWLV